MSWLVYRNLAGRPLGVFDTYEGALAVARNAAFVSGYTYCVRRARGGVREARDWRVAA